MQRRQTLDVNAQRSTLNGGSNISQLSTINSQQLLFGIVQGATFDDLRKSSAQAIVDLDFDGYAVGGVSVGEPEEEMMRAVEASEPFLPAGKPRYAMGLGTPPQLLEMIARGVTCSIASCRRDWHATERHLPRRVH